MTNGAYFTRAAWAASKRALKDTAKVGLGIVAAKYAERAARRVLNSRARKTVVKRQIAKTLSGKGASRTRSLGGGSSTKKFSSYRPKPIKNSLKGVNKKFVAKVQKVINNNESWGEYMHIGSKQLRQINRDEWNIESADEFSTAFVLDSTFSIQNAASILWNSKTSVNDIEDVSNNIDKGTAIKVLNSQIEMFFKSTSSHVVNLELYECTSKVMDSSTADARAWAETTFDDYEFSMRRDNASLSPGIARFGVEPRHMTSLHQKFNVKVHKIKLGPGEHSYLKIRGMRRNYDFSQQQGLGGSTERYVKGSKSFFFRIINDVTCSTSINRIHAWPSNEKGGVALRYQTTYRIAPPKMTPIGTITTLPPAFIPATRVRNVVKIHQSYNSENDSADQQVTYCNPASLATVDS